MLKSTQSLLYILWSCVLILSQIFQIFKPGEILISCVMEHFIYSFRRRVWEWRRRRNINNFYTKMTMYMFSECCLNGDGWKSMNKLMSLTSACQGERIRVLTQVFCFHQSRLEQINITTVHIVFKLKWGFFVQCRGTRGRTFWNITSTVNTVHCTVTMVWLVNDEDSSFHDAILLKSFVMFQVRDHKQQK